MAIAKQFSTQINATLPTPASSNVDNTLNIGTGTNRAMITAVVWTNNNAHSIAEVRWNGISHTAFGAQTDQGSLVHRRSFHLTAPAENSATHRVTTGSATPSASTAMFEVYVYNGVDQTTPFDAYDGSPAGADGSSPFQSTVTISSATGDKVWVSHAAVGSGGAITSGAPTGFTEHHDSVNTGLAVVSGDQDGAASVATTVTWTTGGFQVSWNAHGCNINAASGGVTTVTPSAVVATFAIAAPTVVKGAVTLTPSALVAQFLIANPAVSQGQNLTPTPIEANFEVATPVVQKGAISATPAPVIASFDVPAPSVGGTTVITPSAALATFGINAPIVVTGAVTVTPTSVVGRFLIAMPTLLIDGEAQISGKLITIDRIHDVWISLG